MDGPTHEAAEKLTKALGPAAREANRARPGAGHHRGRGAGHGPVDLPLLRQTLQRLRHLDPVVYVALVEVCRRGAVGALVAVADELDGGGAL